MSPACARIRALLLRAVSLALVVVLLAAEADVAFADDPGRSEEPPVDIEVSDEGVPPETVVQEEPAATLSGTVRLTAPGQSAEGTNVIAQDAGTLVAVVDAQVDAALRFTLEVPAGQYVLLFIPPAGSNAREIYSGGVATAAAAQVVTLEAGEVRTDLEAQLPLASVVPGVVQVAGTARVGQDIRVRHSGWLPDDTEFSYQWLRDGSPIRDATSATYRLVAADAARSIQVEITGRADGLEPAALTDSGTSIGTGTLTRGTVSVTGTARVGARLTAATASWPSHVALSYEWQRDGRRISGATARTYTPVAADRNSNVRVVVTGSANGYQKVSRASTARRVTAGVLTAPRPQVTGTVRVGSTLRVVTGAWTSGTRLTYEWRVNGRRVVGHTGTSYRVRAADLGARVTVRVTGTRAGYTTVTRSSAATAAATQGVFSSRPTPYITGTVRTGSTLRANVGSWAPTARLSYQWRVNGTAVRGATAVRYTVRAADRGKRITVTVTARRDAYRTVTRTSASTSRVVAPFTRTARPTISGTARVGATLTARTGSWSPAPSFRYQWYADGRAIASATRSTLRLTTAHYGARITVRVTGSRSTYVTRSRTSVATVKVVAPAPTLRRDGMYRVGSDIAAGTYAAPGGRACYWERRNRAGNSFAGIITNDFSTGGRVIVTIRNSDRYFMTEGCGSWTRLMPSGPQRTSFGDGFHAVGNHIRPGTYRTPGRVGCYWEISRNFSGEFAAIVDNQYTSSRSQQIVRIQSGQSFHSDGCGTWTRTGS